MDEPFKKQVRAVRFYVSWPAFLLLPPPDPSAASSGSKCSPPDPHRKLKIRVFPAGPPPQAPDQSVPRQTSNASSGSKCSLPDLNRKLRIRVFPAGPQPQRISEDIPGRMPERISEDMPYARKKVSAHAERIASRWYMSETL